MKQGKFVFLISFAVQIGFILGNCAGAGADTTLDLSLDECFKRALSDNLSLQAAGLSIPYEKLSVGKAESVFDPSLSFEVNRERSGAPNYTSYIPVDKINEKQSSASLSIGQTVFTGAKWGFGVYNALSESNVERIKNYSSYVGVSLSQPLLRGRGKRMTQSDVYIARLSVKSSIHAVEENAITTLADVERAYWNLVYARKTLEVRGMALAQSESLLAYNEKGRELGVLIDSDVLEAKSAYFSRKQEVLEQEIQIQSAEDALKLLLNITSNETGDIRLFPTDPLSIPEVDLDSGAAMEAALRLRPDYLQSLSGIEQQKMRHAVARNAILPSLALNASYRLNGSGATYDRNLRQIRDADAFGWQLGLSFAYPLNNRDAKSEYARSEIELKRAQLNLEALKNNILTDIRSATNTVETNRKRIDVAKLAVEANELKLKKEEEKFRNHLSTSYLVLQYQTDLANSRNLYHKALMDYTLSVLALRQSRGTLLKDLNISIISKDN